MKQYARVEDGTVEEIINRSDTFDMSNAYHPSLVWVEITGIVPIPQEGWIQTGEVFEAPSPPPLPQPSPLNAEELYAMLKAKGILLDSDRPRPKPVIE